MIQLLAMILFFVVFILLFIALSLYLGVTVYTFFKKDRKEQATSDKAEKPS